MEMTRADLKHGRRGSRTPFELLDNPSSASDREAWIEYVQAMRGRHILDVSPSLRALASLDVRSDEEIVADTTAQTLEFWIDADVYQQGRRRSGWLAEVLDLTERDPAEAAARFGMAG